MKIGSVCTCRSRCCGCVQTGVDKIIIIIKIIKTTSAKLQVLSCTQTDPKHDPADSTKYEVEVRQTLNLLVLMVCCGCFDQRHFSISLSIVLSDD